MRGLLALSLMCGLSFACPLTADVIRLIDDAAQGTGLESQLLTALLWQESRFCHLTERGEVITSPVGALGIAQLMPETAAGLGVDPRDLAQNITGAARYLRMQWDAFGSWPLALAAYNAGPGAVTRWGDVPPYPETQLYVRDVLARYAEEHSQANNLEPVERLPALVSRREHHVASAVIYRR